MHWRRRAETGWLEDILIPPDEGIGETDVAIVGLGHAEAFRHGRIIELDQEQHSPGNPLRVYDTDGGFLRRWLRGNGGRNSAVQSVRVAVVISRRAAATTSFGRA